MGTNGVRGSTGVNYHPDMDRAQAALKYQHMHIRVLQKGHFSTKNLGKPGTVKYQHMHILSLFSLNSQ